MQWVVIAVQPFSLTKRIEMKPSRQVPTTTTQLSTQNLPVMQLAVDKPKEFRVYQGPSFTKVYFDVRQFGT